VAFTPFASTVMVVLPSATGRTKPNLSTLAVLSLALP